MAENPYNGKSNRKRLGTAWFSLGSAVGLASAKFVVGVLSGSLGVLSSAADSLADIFMSAVNLLSIRKSMDPADSSHPYGHGKVETLATVFQGAVIAATGAWVIREGIRRLVEGRVPDSEDAGIVVMAIALAASWFISRRIRKAGEETGSSALVADSVHFATDVFTNAGILCSLLVYRITGWAWLDPGVALVVGVYILVAAGRLLFPALQDLVDRGLPEETVDLVKGIITEHRPMIVDFHDLRTRRAGSEKHVDFHVVVCREYKLEDAHRVADHLEKEVRQALGNAHVVTHIDPCELECPGIDHCVRVLSEIRKLTDPPEREEESTAGKG
ncbi:MAG TPA: cation diffusion facilitator family transporter [Candidatus Deferrimicrobiaceae bacterium]|nr:cation diffusion facilitator family transporter [Candidatus Deferrimicrobiaceae bacterium]